MSIGEKSVGKHQHIISLNFFSGYPGVYNYIYSLDNQPPPFITPNATRKKKKNILFSFDGSRLLGGGDAMFLMGSCVGVIGRVL